MRRKSEQDEIYAGTLRTHHYGPPGFPVNVRGTYYTTGTSCSLNCTVEALKNISWSFSSLQLFSFGPESVPMMATKSCSCSSDLDEMLFCSPWLFELPPVSSDQSVHSPLISSSTYFSLQILHIILFKPQRLMCVNIPSVSTMLQLQTDSPSF